MKRCRTPRRSSPGRASAATGKISRPAVSAWPCTRRPIAARSACRKPICWWASLLSAAADTTVLTLANTMRAFCEFPDQYRLVRSDRTLLRAAFEESLRWDSPSRMAGRIAMKDVEIDGYVIPAGERCGLMFAAANRDPRRWEAPDRFEVRRNNRDNLGFGYGVHACVGRVLALLEAEALLGALAESIEHFELAGEPEPWMTTIGHGPIRLPVKARFAAH